MNDRSAENILSNSSQKEDMYIEVRREFSNVFYENNMEVFTNAKDLGFIDINKFSQKSEPQEFEDNQNPYEIERSISKGDLSGAQTPNQAVNKFMSFSPYRGINNQNSALNNPFSGLHLLHKGLDSAGGTPFKYSEKRIGVDVYPHYDSMAYDSHSQEYKDIKQEYIESYGEEPLTAMWSEKPAHMIKIQKPANFEESFTKSRKIFHPYPSYDSYENMEDNKGSQENEIFAPYIIKPEPIKFRPPENEDDRVLQVKAKNSQIQVKKEPSKREIVSKFQPTDYDDDKDDDIGDGKNRSSRGLRVLSLKVKDIVNEKKKTSYKEVAETLIRELNRKHRAQSNGSGSKDEQNVKRRVYDALNVLIAADILKKEGKAVFCDDSVANLGLHRRKKMKEEKEKLERDLAEIKRRNKAKHEQLQELAYKFLAVKNLITRNKQKEQAITAKPAEKQLTEASSSSGENQAQPAQGTTIHFPFIVVASSAIDNNINLNMDKSNKQLLIESKNHLNIYGDIDVLLKMKLHRVSKKFFEENISTEMKQYMSSSYLDDLK